MQNLTKMAWCNVKKVNKAQKELSKSFLHPGGRVEGCLKGATGYHTHHMAYILAVLIQTVVPSLRSDTTDARLEALQCHAIHAAFSLCQVFPQR